MNITPYMTVYYKNLQFCRKPKTNPKRTQTKPNEPIFGLKTRVYFENKPKFYPPKPWRRRNKPNLVRRRRIFTPKTRVWMTNENTKFATSGEKSVNLYLRVICRLFLLGGVFGVCRRTHSKRDAPMAQDAACLP